MAKRTKSGPRSWSEYSLIDCGNRQKLERFGSIVLIRPEPYAIWEPKLSEKEWQKRAHAECEIVSNNKANWKEFKSFPPVWSINYPLHGKNLNFEVQRTRYKHVGLFPEHFVNWNFIYEKVQRINDAKVLNLFAYTGGASLAAKAAGADVVHVDSIRQVVTWARKNMMSSGLSDIRWVVEDALKFAQREQRRGNTYNGIILDPPAFGLGAKGERWKLEDSLPDIMKTVNDIVDRKYGFVVLNTYSPGMTPLVIDNILRSIVTKLPNVQTKELFLQSETGFKLPTGVTGIATS